MTDGPRVADQDEESLWVAAPEEFVALRDGLVRRLRAEGDLAAAARVKALRKPTRDAWVLNRLVRTEPAALDPLVELGDRLRAAQESGDAPVLRELSGQRAGLVEAALGRARAASGPMSAGVADAVRATLSAVVADRDAAALVRSGRLTNGLEYAGFGVAPTLVRTDHGDAGESTSAVSSVVPRSARRLQPVSDPDEARVTAAEQSLRAAEDEVTAAQLARAEAQEQVDELAVALDEAKSALNDAQAEVRAATRARDAAAAALERLRRRAR